MGRRFLDRTQPSLEAQLCNLADEIAYNAHDIDDGVRSGLITLDQLQDVPLVARFTRETLAAFPALTGRRLLYETIRRMLSAQVYDVMAATAAGLSQWQPQDVDAARQAPPLLRFTEGMRAESTALKRFLFANLYRHPQVVANTVQAQQVVQELFVAYMNDTAQMKGHTPGEGGSARAVADYIAGMTDRFAAREHERLTGRSLIT